MTLDTVQSTHDRGKKETNYSYEAQTNYNRYLDQLKQEFHSHPVIDAKQSLEDFAVIENIASGGFSELFFVREKSSLTVYAMKVIEKGVIVKKNLVKQLTMEKKILQSVGFTFVLEALHVFKDNVYVFFITPFYSGGDLYKLLKKVGPLDEDLAQFYTAQVILGLEYLHHCSVVHRDLKPENILIHMNGYIVIGDLGFAKIIKGRTWTLCGTPEYIAPEIINSKGYSFAVDWWSLGVLIFEITSGYPPFYNADPIKLYDKILAGKYKAPETMSAQGKSLVKHLLCVDPNRRYGSLKSGVFDIKNHPWLSEINWQLILEQKFTPRFIPKAMTFKDKSDVKLRKSETNEYEEEFANF